MYKQIVERVSSSSLIGVDISADWVKVAEVVERGEELLLRRAVVKAVQNKNPIPALKDALVEGKFRTKNVALAVASPEVVVHPFQFAPLSKKELESAIRLEAEHAMLNSHLANKVTVDWQLLGPRSDNVRGVLAAAPKEVLGRQLQIAKAAGLSPSVVDVKGLALWNAYWSLSGSREKDQKTVLLVNIEPQVTTLIIIKTPDELILVRDINLGADAFKDSRKQEWISEFYDSMVYAKSKEGLRELQTAFVTGGEQSKEVLETLEGVLAMPVKTWNGFDFISHESNIHAMDLSLGPLFSVAIGLALRNIA